MQSVKVDTRSQKPKENHSTIFSLKTFAVHLKHRRRLFYVTVEKFSGAWKQCGNSIYDKKTRSL